MATASQLAANRRTRRSPPGRACKHGMTAKTVLIPHECAQDYEEIRAALLADYAPASSHEETLVDQIAAGYWRTIALHHEPTYYY
jgi:hypothetical protein